MFFRNKQDAMYLSGALIIFIILGVIYYIVVSPVFCSCNKQGNKIATTIGQNQNKGEMANLDTSDWKVYRNEEYGFEVKYPSEWFVDEEYSASNDKFITFCNYSKTESENMDVVREDLLAYFVRVYNPSDKYKRFEDEYQKASNEQKYYDAGNNKQIRLYIVLKRRDQQNNLIWESITPDAKAFLEDDNYSYMFHFGVSDDIKNYKDITRDEDERIRSLRREKGLEVFKKALETFKLIK